MTNKISAYIYLKVEEGRINSEEELRNIYISSVLKFGERYEISQSNLKVTKVSPSRFQIQAYPIQNDIPTPNWRELVLKTIKNLKHEFQIESGEVVFIEINTDKVEI